MTLALPCLARAAACGLLLAALAPAVPAASSAASSASDSASTSVGSLSKSLGRSSDSSTPNRVAAGPYRIVAVAELGGQPELLQLTLRAIEPPADVDQGELLLRLPRAAAERAKLAAGAVIDARTRPYGIEFARGGEAFFLVLADDWQRELGSHPVEL